MKRASTVYVFIFQRLLLVDCSEFGLRLGLKLECDG
jgi:hypothetical protein